VSENYPDREFPTQVVGALASFFHGGSGPTHARLNSAIDFSEVVETPAPFAVSKENRVRDAFSQASTAQSYILAAELVTALREDGSFEQDPVSTERARAAFNRAGASFVDGYVDWDGAAGSAPQNISGIGAAVAEVGRYGAALGSHFAVSAAAPELGANSGGPDRIANSTGAALDKAIVSPAAPYEIFLVHGHDEAALHEVESFVIRTTGILPIILMLEPSMGQTVIEKFEANAKGVGYAIVLMTPDDFGGAEGQASSSRPRQNVVFEFGYFVSALGRSHVAALISPNVEKPSDVNGLVYIPFARGSDWKENLRKEMRAASVPML